MGLPGIYPCEKLRACEACAQGKFQLPASFMRSISTEPIVLEPLL